MFLSPVNHQDETRQVINHTNVPTNVGFFPPFESANSSVTSAGGGTCPGTLPADESQQMLPSLRVSVNGSAQVKTVVSILDRLVLDEPPCLSRSRGANAGMEGS